MIKKWVFLTTRSLVNRPIRRFTGFNPRSEVGITSSIGFQDLLTIYAPFVKKKSTLSQVRSGDQVMSVSWGQNCLRARPKTERVLAELWEFSTLDRPGRPDPTDTLFSALYLLNYPTDWQMVSAVQKPHSINYPHKHSDPEHPQTRTWQVQKETHVSPKIDFELKMLKLLTVKIRTSCMRLAQQCNLFKKSI